MSSKTQYRLLKWYPTLPKDWEPGMIVGYGDRYGPAVAPCNAKYTQTWIDDNQVKNNPEFWEKVEQKDYEILSFLDTETKILITIRSNGYYVYGNSSPKHCPNSKGATLQEVLYDEDFKDCEIHSVKRLSDGEVFTIGDKVKSVRTDVKYTINRFIIGDKPNEIGINNGHGWCELGLSVATKITEPLFTTQDGVDIYEGDSWWTVHIDSYRMIHVTDSKDYSPRADKLFRFSTEKKAKKWIDDRKNKHYTRQQVIQAMTDACVGLNIIDQSKLEKALNLK